MSSDPRTRAYVERRLAQGRSKPEIMRVLEQPAQRVGRPARTIMPQVVRTVKLAEDLANKMSGPVEQVVPGLVRLADTLSSPVFATLPKDLSGFVDSINDLVRRLSPLGQIAESAGGLFGLRIPVLSRSPAAPPPSAAAAVAEPATEATTKKPAKKASPRKAAAKGAAKQ